MKAKFKVVGRFDKATVQDGTVTIDRASGLFSVRPKGSRREFTLGLSVVAEIVVAKIAKIAAAQARDAKGR